MKWRLHVRKMGKTFMLSLHSKQPKRGMISCEKGYIEIMEYPRAWDATLTYAESGETEVIKEGENADALAYELADMITAFRNEWGFKYPEEEYNSVKNKNCPITDFTL